MGGVTEFNRVLAVGSASLLSFSMRHKEFHLVVTESASL